MTLHMLFSISDTAMMYCDFFPCRDKQCGVCIQCHVAA